MNRDCSPLFAYGIRIAFVIRLTLPPKYQYTSALNFDGSFTSPASENLNGSAGSLAWAGPSYSMGPLWRSPKEALGAAAAAALLRVGLLAALAPAAAAGAVAAPVVDPAAAGAVAVKGVGKSRLMSWSRSVGAAATGTAVPVISPCTPWGNEPPVISPCTPLG